ncbi:MAG: sigma-70 family RNA polymerase sigma factor [Lewinellaceae bacterium]|nr:sigma-70 family RNA polymerase sigma factor [Lewinellaceae bacterium]
MKIGILKSEIIREIYENNFVLIYSISSHFFNSNEDRKDAIHGFIADKICERSIDEIKKFLMPKYLYRSFENYCKDIYRKQKRKREKTEQYIERINRQSIHRIDIIDGNISDKMEETIQGYRRGIRNRFGRDHVIIFELIICGYSNPKIGEIMEKPTATIGTIKHRIKKFIIEKIAV